MFEVDHWAIACNTQEFTGYDPEQVIGVYPNVRDLLEQSSRALGLGGYPGK